MTTKLPSAEEIAEDVGFSEAFLDDNMIKQPSLVAHYGRLLSELQYDMDTNKQKLDIQEAKSGQKMRDDAASDGVKITESQINSTLATVPEVIKRRMSYNRSKADFEAMRVALEALRHKKDMMVQIGVNRRTELENKINGLVNRSEQQSERDRETRAAAKSVKVTN